MQSGYLTSGNSPVKNSGSNSVSCGDVTDHFTYQTGKKETGSNGNPAPKIFLSIVVLVGASIAGASVAKVAVFDSEQPHSYFQVVERVNARVDVVRQTESNFVGVVGISVIVMDGKPV